MNKLKLYLVIYNKEIKKKFTKYFNTEKEMNNFINKCHYSKKLMIIEDSRDIYYGFN